MSRGSASNTEITSPKMCRVVRRATVRGSSTNRLEALRKARTSGYSIAISVPLHSHRSVGPEACSRRSSIRSGRFGNLSPPTPSIGSRHGVFVTILTSVHLAINISENGTSHPVLIPSPEHERRIDCARHFARGRIISGFCPEFGHPKHSFCDAFSWPFAREAGDLIFLQRCETFDLN